MSSTSSAGTDCQITEATSPDLSAKSPLPAVPLRYIPMPDRYCPIRKKHIMVWASALSTFVLNRVCKFINNGVPMDKGFRMRDMKAIAEAIIKYTGHEVSTDQIYNHLRHWRARWVHVIRLKMLEDVRWEEKTTVIMMDDEAYYAHIESHPKDAELIDKPVENYAQMKMIYSGRIPAAPVTPAAIHTALSHLMDHKAQASRYLVMTPAARLAWFTAFLMKYYL